MKIRLNQYLSLLLAPVTCLGLLPWTASLAKSNAIAICKFGSVKRRKQI